jgi:hypothetical protein
MEDENSGKMLETQLTEETETKVEETELEPTIEETELEPTIENNDEKRFTEQEMNEIVRNRLSRQKKKQLHQQLGVENDDEITALIEKVKKADELQSIVESLQNENTLYKEQLTFIEHNIDVKRYDDVKAYFKGKELSLTPENLKAELKTHPEWLAQRSVQTIGGQRQQAPVKDERKAAFELFGIRK